MYCGVLKKIYSGNLSAVAYCTGNIPVEHYKKKNQKKGFINLANNYQFLCPLGLLHVLLVFVDGVATDNNTFFRHYFLVLSLALRNLQKIRFKGKGAND